MGDGFGVRPDLLRRGAADLRADAADLDAARAAASGAAQQATQAAGGQPVAGAASDLASQMDKAMGSVARSLAECADALDATAASYGTGEQRATGSLTDLLAPHLPPPR